MAQSLENYRFENVNYFDSDERGRITLGSEFADSKIFVAWTVMEVDDVATERPPKEYRDKLNELWKWANENDYKMIDSDPDKGRILNSNAEWIDTDVEGLAE